MNHKKLIYAIIGVCIVTIVVLGIIFGKSPTDLVVETIDTQKDFLSMPTYDEPNIEVETIKEIVYVDKDTGEELTTYWYYLWESMDGRIGFSVFESNELHFPMDHVYNHVQTFLEEKYPGKNYDFLTFRNTQRISKTAYDNLQHWKD